MKIDEKEFRSFIARVENHMLNSEMAKHSMLLDTDYVALSIQIDNQLDKYIKMLEQPEKSKWKQLKLIDGDVNK